MPVFECLTQLNLNIVYINMSIDSVVLIKMYQRCPHLEHLNILNLGDDCLGGPQLSPMPLCFQTHLKKITIHSYDPEFADSSINVLLNSAAVLEEMLVYYPRSMINNPRNISLDRSQLPPITPITIFNLQRLPMASSRPPPPRLDLELTIISAKHLKNVNWRSGGILKPYAVFWIDPDRRLATRSDDSGSTKPVWNERFTVPLTLPPSDSVLTLEIFHSETPNPLVATLCLPLRNLDDPDDFSQVQTYKLSRPSGRPQGKIRLKLAIREWPLPPPPNYQIAPPHSYYYHHTTPPPPPPAQTYPYGYPDSYYQQSAYYSAPPPPPSPRPYSDRPYGGPGSSTGPSAPVDYTLPYEQKPKSRKIGLGTGAAVGGLAGAMGGLALDEGLKYEEESVVAPSELGARTRTDYAGYRVEY